MSYDVYLWRRRPGAVATDSLIYAMIAENLEVDELEPLDFSHLTERIEELFPGCSSADEPWFQYVFSDRYIVVETWLSTPREVFTILAGFCADEGLRLFDPQGEKVANQDIRTARRLASKQRGEEQRRIAKAIIAELEERAAMGDAEAQYELGNRYSFGEGVRCNAAKAFHWYEKAARGGSPGGMFNLAACYHHGDGAPRDLSKAIEWYELASVHDRMLAPFALGEIFSGPSMRDHARAKAYFLIALENGHPDAEAALRGLDNDALTDDEKKRAWCFWMRK